MDKIDWGQVVALVTVIGLYTHMVVEWIKTKTVQRQICHYLNLDEHGNPTRDTEGRLRQTLDADAVKEIIIEEMSKGPVPNHVRYSKRDGDPA